MTELFEPAKECCTATSDEATNGCPSDDEALQPCVDRYGRPCWFNNGTKEFLYHIEPPRPPSAMQGVYPNPTTAPGVAYGNAFVPGIPQAFYPSPMMSTFAIPPVGQPMMPAVPPPTMSPMPTTFQPIMQIPTSSGYSPPTTPFANVDNVANAANVANIASNKHVNNQDAINKEKKTPYVDGRIKRAEKPTQGEKGKEPNLELELELELEVPIEKEETSESTSTEIPHTELFADNDVSKETINSEPIINSELPGENFRFAQLNTNVSLDVPGVENAKGGKLGEEEDRVKVEQVRKERAKAEKEKTRDLKEEKEGANEKNEEKEDAKMEGEEDAKNEEEDENEGKEDAKEEEEGTREEGEEGTKEEEGIRELEEGTEEGENAKNEEEEKEEEEEGIKGEEEGTEEGEDAKNEMEDIKDEAEDANDETEDKGDTTEEKTEESEDTTEDTTNERQNITKEVVEVLAPPVPRPKKYTTARFGWF